MVSEPTSFYVTLTPSTTSLSIKQPSTTQVILASFNGFADNLALSCVGLPQAATCTFSTDHQAPAANGTQMLSLTIDTGSPLIAGGEAQARVQTVRPG